WTLGLLAQWSSCFENSRKRGQLCCRPRKRLAARAIGVDQDVATLGVEYSGLVLAFEPYLHFKTRAAQPVQDLADNCHGRIMQGFQEITRGMSQYAHFFGGYCHSCVRHHLNAGLFEIAKINSVIDVIQGIEIAPAQ